MMDSVPHSQNEDAFNQAPSPPRFLADEDFHGDIVAGLRRANPAIDILSAAQAETLGLKDPDVLIRAKDLNRILLSHDRRTMPAHFYAFLAQLATGEHSPGVMLISQEIAIGEAIQAVLLIWKCSRHDEWPDMLVRLPL